MPGPYDASMNRNPKTLDKTKLNTDHIHRLENEVDELKQIVDILVLCTKIHNEDFRQQVISWRLKSGFIHAK